MRLQITRVGTAALGCPVERSSTEDVDSRGWMWAEFTSSLSS